MTLSRGQGHALVSRGGREVNVIRWDGRSLFPTANETIRAYRCRLYPCIKTFEADISRSQIKETVVEETDTALSDTVLENFDLSNPVADLTCLDNPDQRNILKQLGYQFDNATRWLPYNVSLGAGTAEHPVLAPTVNNNPCNKAPGNQFPNLCSGNQMTTKALKTIPARCIYTIKILTMNTLYEYVRKLFTGTVSTNSYGLPDYGDGMQGVVALYNAGSGNGTLEDLQGIMRNVTDALTTYIRQAGDEGFSEPAIGDMSDYATCVQVRWV